MKKLSQLVKESKTTLDIQEDTINYIGVNELKKYLQIADKFICDDTKELIQYLIVNNANYVNEMTSKKSTSGNALADFYNDGPYKDGNKKEIYILIGKIIKSGRMLEIPVLQTEEQFNGIISGNISPDEIILDLYSEKGRSVIAKKYEKLCYKIALSFKGKSNIEFEDLLSSAFEGLTWAMNNYGRKSKKDTKLEIEDEEISQNKATTFLTYASYCIRFHILAAIQNESHLVRIPVNKQSEERKEKGHNSKNNAVSGDKVVGGDEKGKTLFDYVSDMESAGKSVDEEDIKIIWTTLMKRLKECGKFSDKMINAWIQFNQLDGAEKKKNKELAAELGITPSNITYYCYIINQFIKTDPKMRVLANDLRELYAESLQRYYEQDDREECHSIKIQETNIDY
jgi:hypothetical protein